MQKRFGTKDSVRCSEFGDGRFLDVANVLQVWDFQSVTIELCPLYRECVCFFECLLREVLLYRVKYGGSHCIDLLLLLQFNYSFELEHKVIELQSEQK